MSHIEEGNRVYIKDLEYGEKVRTFLGIEDSAVVVLDDGSTYLGYCGLDADLSLIDPVSKENGLGEVIPDLETDFRTTGIDILTAMGVDTATQAKMLTIFMHNYTLDQRKAIVAQYDAIAASGNEENIRAFAQQMLKMLT